jgi:alkanesulfonate monooxygenase SsuD/methylene tetrahydromethanopterin reductase-like flavin-dependent oxidoreductase (luciferase family)|tara:strand:- start:1591 stop:2631 length:1041 start_codon:yes stop_codon:yes gene_type:complete
MRFGSWVFPISQNSKNDGHVIDDTLTEIDRWEALGFDSIWLSEHHFDGATAYADPVVFAGAIAQRTKNVTIGFAVVEMALHHPVRLAAQVALLDHLSKGRMMLGTGKGSAFNEYEYIGFGVPMSDAADSISEAEEIILEAWTGEPVEFKGKYWDLAFPELRPMPLQKPHPPLLRACISRESTIEMGSKRRPILIAAQENHSIKDRLQVFTKSLESTEITESEIEDILDQVWVNKNIVVAESRSEAEEIAFDGYTREQTFFKAARDKYNPKSGSQGLSKPREISKKDFDNIFITGTPKDVAEQISELDKIGVKNLMMKINTGEMDQSIVFRTMDLLAEHVKPFFPIE